MAYTAEQVITMAQRFLVDVDDDAYLANALSYLNEGQRRFASETHCCQSAVDVAIAASINSIPYSDIVTQIGATTEEVLYIVKVTPKTGTNYTPLPKAPVSEMRALQASSETSPTRYSLFADAIYFDTFPTTTLNLTFTILCSFVPKDLSATTENILIPTEWVQALVKYIVYCCRIQDRDAGLANGAYQEFEAIKQQAANVFISQIERIPGAA